MSTNEGSPTVADPDAPDDGEDVVVQVQPFAAIVRQLRDGITHDEASRELAQLVREVKNHGKGGKLTLTINISPSKVDNAVQVRGEVKVSPPKDQSESLFYTDQAGSLSRRDPRQPELPIQAAPDLDQPRRTA